MTKADATKYAIETINELHRLAAEAQALGDKKLVRPYEEQIAKVTAGWG
jgi:hypothetical protein